MVEKTSEAVCAAQVALAMLLALVLIVNTDQRPRVRLIDSAAFG